MRVELLRTPDALSFEEMVARARGPMTRKGHFLSSEFTEIS